MPQVTEEERKRFHIILDDSIDKMNNPKNEKKEHWQNLTIQKIQKMVNVENAELESAVYDWNLPAEVETESFDMINLNLMIIDNMRGNN